MTHPNTKRSNPIARLWDSSEGAVSVETIIILPMLLWALASTVVFYDGFRTRYHAQMAAQTVADIMSRETDLFTEDYVDGMNSVFDYLVDARIPTRIRVSSVIWDSENERNRLQWSYGTRDLSALPERTFELLETGDLETLTALFGTETGFSFAAAASQMPVEDFAQRIPPVLPGEALLVVESFALWTPFASVGVGQLRFTPVVVVRPRFAPWINFEGIEPIFPEDDYETEWIAGDDDDDDDDDDGDDDDIVPPDPGSGVSFNFDSGVTTGWSSGTTTSGSAGGGSFLGPFGPESYDTPVSLAVNLGASGMNATIGFDLMLFDGWDGFSASDALPRGDTFTIMIDDEPITLDAFDSDASGLYGRARVAEGIFGTARFELTMTPERTGDNFYGGLADDQLWRVELLIANAPETFDLGFSAGTNERISAESFGIDNLSYAASATGGATPASPATQTRYDWDSLTRFGRFEGCPDETLPAPWLSVAVSDLSDRRRNAFSIQRVAGGPTNLRGCSQVNGLGSISAAPQLVLNYDNQGLSRSPNRLRLLMDDGNSGYTCDTTLVVRDPNGQWWFNDDTSGYNAGIRFGNAVSGAYEVWIGTYGSAECLSRLQIYRY